MKKLYTLLIVLFYVSAAIGQSCLPEGIYFGTQEEIDQFKANYPNCTEVEGSVEISGSNITNLDSLHLITDIGDGLEIYNVPGLISIEGLSALSSVGGSRLGIFGSSLSNLHGLENLVSVPGMRIDGNTLLTSLEGLGSLKYSPGGVYITENPLLTDLSGLESLVDVGQGGVLTIKDNESLISLVGIDNIVFDPLYQTEVWITNNPLLSECEVESICNLLNDDGIIHVSGNATGCLTIDEVRDECATAIEELLSDNAFAIYPNPSTSTITFELPIQPSRNTSLILSNTNGRQLINHPITEPKTEIDMSYLPAGIYIVKVWNDKDVMVQKVIKQ